ncbi:hypothetical protein [Niastella yeongjuensis]|nr:hypothetical protein [Niastella yeongjuensis]
MIYIDIGDVLFFKATGGHQLSGKDVIELIGIFSESLLLSSGEKIYPEGLPNIVLFKAIKQGKAMLSIVVGGSWDNPMAASCEVTVGIK